MGRALLRQLIAKETELRRRYDVRWRLAGVATRRNGWVANSDGLNPIAILNGHFPSPTTGAQPQNFREWLERCRADVLFEASSLEVQTGQPAIDHIRTALEMGAHAITANKGPIVHAFRELAAVAQQAKKQFLYEATVMDGAPIFSMFPMGLPATELRGFTGVLNSTTNVVLTEIEKGRSFAEAIRRAQTLGVAETDPTADLDGWDAAVKVAALAIVLMGIPVKLEQIQRSGIRELSEEKIRSCRAAGMRYKLVCRAERRGDGVDCSVKPELLLAGDPLANLEGTSSAIRFDLDVFGLSIVEQNPGIEATGYGLLADFVRAVKAS
ncbi:MAG TPA: homoserine dehydrogenase [Candidatus Dormibacteraeota bacterium]|nr:homoserine dehydrogenase [Candidatus Dormibacteraeota bacterium]